MKKTILTVIIIFGLNSLSFAAPDITKVEVMPDAVGWDLESATFLKINQNCKVIHRKVDASGNTLKHVTTILRDAEFTDLIVDINSGTPFMQAINNAVKTKRGI